MRLFTAVAVLSLWASTAGAESIAVPLVWYGAFNAADEITTLRAKSVGAIEGGITAGGFGRAGGVQSDGKMLALKLAGTALLTTIDHKTEDNRVKWGLRIFAAGVLGGLAVHNEHVRSKLLRQRQ